MGTTFTSFYKNKSKELENQLNIKKKKIFELKKIKNLELKENV